MILERIQRCCRSAAAAAEETWPWYDYNAAAQICDACGADVVRSGSKWSSYYCGPCSTAVVALNKKRGDLILPIGRHSLMNAQFIARKRPRPREPAEGLVDSLFSGDRRAKAIGAWRLGRVRAALEAMSTPDSASVSDFLAFADNRRVSSEEIVAELECRLDALDAN